VRRNDFDNYLQNLSRNVSSYLFVNRAQAEHVMQLRLVLEGSALEHLTTVQEAERFRLLWHDIAKQHEALQASDWQMYQEWHFRFHHRIVDGLNNPIISMLYRQVMALMRAPMERAGALPARTVHTIQEHEELVAAAERGDVAGVRQILGRHLQAFFINVQDTPEPDGAAPLEGLAR
jgi:DNA-binding GntR family transcriptional regulator